MNLVQKMSVFGSRVGVAVRSTKVYSARKKVVEQLKITVSEDADIEFGESLVHYGKISRIAPYHVALSYSAYRNGVYDRLVAGFKKYREAIGDLLLGSGRKFAKKADKMINKAAAKNNAQDIADLEADKEDIGDFFNELFDDYEYYLNVFEKLNAHYGIKEEVDLSLN